MRILIRTSKSAIWARRIASIAVPLVAIPIFLHRQRLLTSDVFVQVGAVAGAVTLMSLLVSLIALARLWQTGDQGWGRALSALLLGLLGLVPFAYVAVQALRYPPVTDIATTARSSLPLPFDPEMTRMPTPRMLDATQLEQLFPNVKTRLYPLNLAQTFQIVARLAGQHGWDVQRQLEPGAGLDPGLLDAQVTTLLGWREAVALRVAGDAQSAMVDMRSASVNAEHDLGSNGRRIEDFLAELDDAVTNLLRDNPNANQPAEPESEVAPAAGSAPQTPATD